METDFAQALPSTSSIPSPESSFWRPIKQEEPFDSDRLDVLPRSYQNVKEDQYKKVLSVLPEMRPELLKFQNWIGRIDDPSLLSMSKDEFPLLNTMFLLMRQALSWREHLLGYPSEVSDL